MKKVAVIILILIVCFIHSHLFAQLDDSPLKIFGYFQTSFQHERETINDSLSDELSSFNLQQLNLFLQRDITQNWTTFVNVEIFNNYSSNRSWGGLNLEEAWVKYRKNNMFNLKLGLQIPIFNNLNEIKNRTPLLPYIIRPLVYETSLIEGIPSLKLEEYVPGRAFVQAYGYFPYKDFKLDYAVYLGNSNNVSVVSETGGQSGLDTSSTKLIGGRLGIRLGELKTGISATYDYVNFLKGLEEFYGGSPTRFENISRIRIGGDLSYQIGKFYLESEFIVVNYDDDIPEATIDKEFFYGTLGYYFTEQLLGYISYWYMHEEFIVSYMEEGKTILIGDLESEIKVPTFGLAFNLNERITLKVQSAPVTIDYEKVFGIAKVKHFSVAASIFF